MINSNPPVRGAAARPPAKLRAAGSGRKLSSSMTERTNCCLCTLTCAVPLRMRETVLGETPARSATMVSVVRVVPGVVALRG